VRGCRSISGSGRSGGRQPEIRRRERTPRRHASAIRSNSRGAGSAHETDVCPGEGVGIADPQSTCFAVGKVAKDQIEDYARRKEMTVEEAERWLALYLAYEPSAAGSGRSTSFARRGSSSPISAVNGATPKASA